jgi:acetylornithine deacetylase/succinyl-diaminopimelate desuccinylase-like protein
MEMDEAVELLSRYLQIDTTNPPGNEDKGVRFFAEIFDKEKVAYKTYEAAPGRQSIRAMIPGSGEKKALILLNHIGVVPAQTDQWSFEPFSGEIKDGVEYLLNNFPDDFDADIVLRQKTGAFASKGR